MHEEQETGKQTTMDIEEEFKQRIQRQHTGCFKR
jgi:hypothetical protein